MHSQGPELHFLWSDVWLLSDWSLKYLKSKKVTRIANKNVQLFLRRSSRDLWCSEKGLACLLSNGVWIWLAPRASEVCTNIRNIPYLWGASESTEIIKRLHSNSTSTPYGIYFFPFCLLFSIVLSFSWLALSIESVLGTCTYMYLSRGHSTPLDTREAGNDPRRYWNHWSLTWRASHSSEL